MSVFSFYIQICPCMRLRAFNYFSHRLTFIEGNGQFYSNIKPCRYTICICSDVAVGNKEIYV